MVPYYFCGDEFVGNLTCQRYDAGADPYEQAADLVSRYDNFYLTNNFKRQNATFHTSPGYSSRIRARFFDILREQLTWHVLLRSNLQEYDPDNEFFGSEEGWGAFSAASTSASTSSAGW